MPIYETFSRRKRRAEGWQPDVYQYDFVPEQLRRQVTLILRASIGPIKIYSHHGYEVNQDWVFIRDTLCREWGVFYLSNDRAAPDEDCIGAVLNLPSTNDWLDLVEVCFFLIDSTRGRRPAERELRDVVQGPDDAIDELNFRFREAGLGYQFESGQIIRIDAQLVHAEVVKPALTLLADPRLKGAQDEFLRAHAHYRAGEHEDAIIDANRAFESTMKAICDIKCWKFPNGARASDLIKIIRAKGLLPDYLDQSFDQLISTLKSGLPQVRNEAGGHGQGAAPRATPGYIAGYSLHLAAANIVLLGEALKASE